jgi:hypothetical protein
MSEYPKGTNIGEFGSERSGPTEYSEEDRMRQEKLTQELDTLVAQLRAAESGELASFLTSLPADQIKKIDSGLNMASRGISDLKWVGPARQSEVIQLLEQIDQEADIKVRTKICKQVADIINE